MARTATIAISRHTVRLRSRGHARADPGLALAVAGLAGDVRAGRQTLSRGGIASPAVSRVNTASFAASSGTEPARSSSIETSACCSRSLMLISVTSSRPEVAGAGSAGGSRPA